MSELDLDSLLDGNMAEVENLPDYVTPPTGIYFLGIKDVDLETYTKKGKDGQPDLPNQIRIRQTYNIVEVVEYADEAKAIPVDDGSLFSETFIFDDKGKAIFKRQAAKILQCRTEELDEVSFRDLFMTLKEVEAFKASVVTKEKNGYENTNVRPFIVSDDDD